jgi:hypothetical protein
MDDPDTETPLPQITLLDVHTASFFLYIEHMDTTGEIAAIDRSILLGSRLLNLALL